MDINDALEKALRLHRQGKLREAFREYSAILDKHPDSAPALHLSGVVLHQSGDHAGAVDRIRRSIGIDAAPADPWVNLANALDALDRSEAAVNALKEAARRAPRTPEIWSNLAASELALGRLADAERSARESIAIDPRYPPGWKNLAHVLEPQGRILEALDAASRAAALAPGEIAPAGLKAQIQEKLGQFDNARKTLQEALARNPATADLHLQLATVAERLGDDAAAAKAYENALRLQPGNGPALAQLLFLRKRLCDWHDLANLQTRFRDGVAAGNPFLTPFSFLSDPSSRTDQKRCAENWSAPFARPDARRLASTGRRLRIGYLSGDFHDHPTAVLTAGVFEAHDRSRFEILGYSTGPADGSALRARVVVAFDHFVDAHEKPPDALAERIRADGIDILVDLKGHTSGASPLPVLARRPAPLQAHWLGYPGTLGTPFIDYLIGDPIVTPFDDAPDYSETLVQLPWSYQSNDRSRIIAPAPTRAELGLADGATVFCCFNNAYKLNPGVLDAWASVLTAVPRSMLWLMVRGNRDPAVSNLRREATARGIAAERLVFATRRPHAEYLALYRRADLFLDTWPYNAHTTASDALWAGCPVVTWRGETFAGRVAASLLRAAGMSELVAENVDSYIAKAVALAGDPVRLAALRLHLEGPGRASPLFDVAAFTRALETAYLAMVDQHRAGRREPIRVATATD
jgi:protein O-GlcNAc transferase